MKRLVLGIGNFSKPVLAGCERWFPDVVFGVLDLWSAVQEISVAEGECAVEDTAMRVRRDLSFFVEAPHLAIRFGADKYEQSHTQKIHRYTVDYRDAIGRALEADVATILCELVGFDYILVVTDATDEIAVESFSALLSMLREASNVSVLSLFPAPFRGKILAAYAIHVAQTLNEARVHHVQVFQKDLLSSVNESSAATLFDHTQKELQNILMTMLWDGGLKET